MKKIVIGVIFFVFLGIVLYYLYLPISFNYSFDGIKFTLGEQNFDNVTVKIEGYYMKNFFKNDYSKVKVMINDEVFPNINDFQQIVPYKYQSLSSEFYLDHFKPTEYAENTIIYRPKFQVLLLSVRNVGWEKEENYDHDFGKVYISDDEKEFVITINKQDGKSGSWSLEKGYTIITSTNSTIEAKEMVSKEFGWIITD